MNQLARLRAVNEVSSSVSRDSVIRASSILLLATCIREGFAKLKRWVNWFMVLIIIYAVLTSYCVLLLATAPFLQFGAVGALTLLSSFVFQGFHMAKDKYSKFLIAVVFVVVSAAIFLCPLLIDSPCLIKLQELPEKPKLVGHRGAPMLAPENTMMSFNRSIACGVTAFETDVQLRYSENGFMFKRSFLCLNCNTKAYV
eukprot:superscaffoldBa00000626_g6158